MQLEVFLCCYLLQVEVTELLFDILLCQPEKKLFHLNVKQICIKELLMSFERIVNIQ